MSSKAPARCHDTMSALEAAMSPMDKTDCAIRSAKTTSQTKAIAANYESA
jgi:hypothetical protein